MVMCGVDGCQAAYTKLSSWKSHLYRHHKGLYIYLMMIFFAIHFLLVPQVYIFVYKPLTRLIFSYYLSTKPGCFIFHHSLKAAVMTKQTNSRAGSSWCLKMFLCLACNGTDELCPGATFETASFAYMLAAAI